jgi:hypothetical protein
MLKKVRPAVTIVLDKERHLLMDMNAMVSYEEATGKNILDPATIASFAKNPTTKDIRALLWACLLHEDEMLTIKQVGKWVTPDRIKGITALIGQAFDNAMPEEGKEEDAPLAQKDQAG